MHPDNPCLEYCQACGKGCPDFLRKQALISQFNDELWAAEQRRLAKIDSSQV